MQEEKRQKLPTNIKQVGCISHGLKIYVEDYVYTYIQQYASFAECDEKIGILTGKKEVFEGEDILFINGMIQGKYSKNEAGMEVLTEESGAYIEEEKEKYFNNDEILGWVYIQPGYGDFLNSTLINYHEKNFKKYYSVLFIYDPLEKVNGFFCKNEVLGGLEAVKGYFIYYDRNEGMHEYMLQNKFVKPKEREDYLFGDDIDIKDSDDIEDSPEAVKDVTVEKIRNSFSKERDEKRNIDKKPYTNKSRMVRRKGKIIIEQKRLVNFLGSLSAVLFCACVVMGASIIKNDNRINNVEKQMAAMDNSYTYLIKTIKEGNVQSVFAAKSERITEPASLAQTVQPATEKITQKPTETTTKKPTETTTIKPTETTTEKPTEKPTETTTIKAVNNAVGKTAPGNGRPAKYTVKEGDSLSSISIKFYGTSKKAQDIMSANKIDDPDKIYYGMVLKLP